MSAATSEPNYKLVRRYAPDLYDALRNVLDAYTTRFAVPGRGLVGPIDEEIKAARAALAKVDAP